jgi:hypothetical protein
MALEGGAAKGKNRIQLAANEDGVGETTDRPEGHHVVHVIDKANTSLNGRDSVVMEPQGIGAHPLFVDEGLPLTDVF